MHKHQETVGWGEGGWGGGGGVRDESHLQYYTNIHTYCTCMFPNMSILGNKQDFKLQVTRLRLVKITSQSHILYSDTVVIAALILYDSAILNQIADPALDPDPDHVGTYGK